ncbi:hypothetical protein HK100_005482 [Physocladia obscura]|uniref:Tyrosinase copper-binding domain-containing protein n=1 Tax=Physocladia obscura TaxID=109957 RepID=A0AAD5SSH0_9FUNG|nr:hypothetical protein HK100_005482 [Physocladia obscura]
MKVQVVKVKPTVGWGLVAAMVLAEISGAGASACTAPLTRVEWSTLTSAQKAQYVAAVKTLADRPQNAAGVIGDSTTISLKDFTNLHARASPWAHGSAEFYPYHRAMMHVFEQAMQTAGWSGGVPYWDWPAMNTNWWTSDILSSTYLGSPSSGKANNCVVDGVFAYPGYTVAVMDSDTVAYEDGMHATSAAMCLSRCGAVGSAATAPSDINTRYGALTYATFRGDAADNDDDESGFHASGHETIGGTSCQSDMGNPSISPNDPLFWLHHSFVDKVWWRWQQRCPAFMYDYEGPLTINDPIDLADSQIATMTQDVDTWGITVGQLLNPEGDVLCFTYTTSASDLTMPAVNCPAFTGIPSAAAVTTSSSSDSNSTSSTNSTSSSGTTSGTATVTLADVWVNKLLMSLIVSTSSLSFSDSTNATVVVFGRDDTSTVTPIDYDSVIDDSPTHYEISAGANGTILITYIQGTNKTLSIPAGERLRFVYRSYAETYNSAGKITRYYIDTPLKPYVPTPGAPTNVTAGDPCYQMYPNPTTDKWIKMHQLNYNKIRNSEARTKERIDQWNIDNCGPVNGTANAAATADFVGTAGTAIASASA